MRLPARIPILYLILAILVLASVVPIYFYSSWVISTNKEALKVNEQLLENEITRSLREEISQRQAHQLTMLGNFASAVEAASGGTLQGERLNNPQLRALMERFVVSSNELAYMALLNPEAKFTSAGRVQPDPFMQKEIERAFTAARQGHSYVGQPLSVGSGQNARTLLLVSAPLAFNGRFAGVVAAFEDLQFLVDRLRGSRESGLSAYVVDRQGRLVAGASPQAGTGQDMTASEIVRNYVEQAGKVQFASTMEFTDFAGAQKTRMLGTYSVVPALGWAVVAQKSLDDAYRGVYHMQWLARMVALLSILASMMISIWSARSLTRPLDVLIENTQAISRGEFSRRVDLKSRTEIAQLAHTFNSMAESLERYIADLKRAAEENRALFLSSIQMLAGAVDEKDPYTRGHSDRVTRYSVLLAQELDLSAEEVEVVRVAAQLHDVGKIGIEDRVLKKPGKLSPEEFEQMKTHTTKGANILRPVRQLREMLPGIELHHETLDGRGYPYGLKGAEIPLLPRIIAVADTLDAMTTNRPYQTAMDPEHVVQKITSWANTRFDPNVVRAMKWVFERGDLMESPKPEPEPELPPELTEEPALVPAAD